MTRHLQPMTLQEVGAATPCAARGELFAAAGNAAPGFPNLFEAEARDLCEGACPAFADCLMRTLRGKPVAGFVAGTTEEQRAQLMAALGVTAEAEGDLSTIAGASRDGRSQVDPELMADTILRLPDASNAEIGRRMGCDAKTVARARAQIASKAAELEAARRARRSVRGADVRVAYLQIVRDVA